MAKQKKAVKKKVCKLKNNKKVKFDPNKILAICDDRDTLEVIKITGSKLGYQIDTEADPLQGIEKIKKDGYGLVLLDIIMEPVGGYAVVKKLRKLCGNKLKVVLMSGKVKEDVDMTGVDAFIGKPFEIDTFYELLKKWTK